MTDDIEAERLITQHLQWLRRTRGASEKTISERGRVLRFAHRLLPEGLRRVSEQDIDDFFDAGEAGGWKPWTTYAYDSALRVFFGWAIRKGKLDLNPMEDLAKPDMPLPKPRPMSDEHLAVLLAAVEPIPTVTMLGRYQGLRIGEVAGLWREDLTEATTYIRRAKGGKPATVPTHPIVWAHLRDRPSGPLIVGERTGRPVSAAQLCAIWRRERNRLGLPPDVVSHCNRHRFGTDLRRQTGDILLTAKGLRHRLIETTRIYTEVTDEETAVAIRALGGLEPARNRLEPPTHAA